MNDPATSQTGATLAVLEHLAYVIEALAQDLPREASHTLAELARDLGDAEHLGLEPALRSDVVSRIRTAQELLKERRNRQAASALSGANRGLWRWQLGHSRGSSSVSDDPPTIARPRREPPDHEGESPRPGRGRVRVPTTYPRLRAILCADWSKDPRHRDVYLADVAHREVRRLTAEWTVTAVIDAAREAAGDGAALATFDAPLGVPISYWEKLCQAPGFPEGNNPRASSTPHEAARRRRT